MINIITVGGATKDISFTVDSGVIINNHRDLLRQELLAFERGAKIKVEKFHHLFGGGAANAAVNFSKSGFNVSCAVAIGDDYEGREILANFKKHKIKTDLVMIEKGIETGFSFVLIEEEGARIIFANRCANDDFFLKDSASGKLKGADWIYLASLGRHWEKTLKVLIKDKDLHLAWNPGALQYSLGGAALAPYLKRTELLLMNREEAIKLVSSFPAYRHQNRRFFLRVENLLAALKSFGPRMVVITSGVNGADAFDGSDFYHQEIVKVQNKMDTTGIGDVFNSSVLIGLLLSGGNLKISLKIAAKNAAAKISNLGAQNGIIDLRPYFKK
ncbi:MAG: carbohydrate kinase family protein [Patescibacteria group bacterium]